MMIFLILLLGLVIRLTNLGQSLWLDEAIEILAVKSNSLLDLVTKYSLGDFHAPLYHVVLKFWDSLFGFSEVASRLPSAFFGLGTVYLAFAIGKKLFSRKVGLIAALFLAINPLSVYYSQEARMYSLAAFAVSLAVFFFIEKKWLWFTVSLLIALYTDYLPWFMLPAFFFLAKDKKMILKSYLLIFLFLLPWLPFLWQQLRIGTSAAGEAPLWGKVVGGFDIKALPLTFVKFIIGRISIDNKLLYGLIITPVGLLYAWALARVKNLLLWSWLLIPTLIGFALSVKIPVYSYFRFLFVLPAFILLLAAGVRGNKLLTFVVIVVSLASLAIFNLHPNFQREDWRATVAYIHSQPGEAILPSIAQSSPLRYYDSNLAILDKDSLQLPLSQTVYLFRYVQEIFDREDSARKFLEQSGYHRTWEKAFNGILVWQYQK